MHAALTPWWLRLHRSGCPLSCGAVPCTQEERQRAANLAARQAREAELRRALLELDGPNIDAIVQVGTNLAMARLAARAEAFLEKPVIAINTAIYWHALRQNGFTDQMQGFGALLAEH